LCVWQRQVRRPPIADARQIILATDLAGGTARSLFLRRIKVPQSLIQPHSPHAHHFARAGASAA
jgi:hypothetical protein